MKIKQIEIFLTFCNQEKFLHLYLIPPTLPCTKVFKSLYICILIWPNYSCTFLFPVRTICQLFFTYFSSPSCSSIFNIKFHPLINLDLPVSFILLSYFSLYFFLLFITLYLVLIIKPTLIISFALNTTHQYHIVIGGH